jgi:hypothetical protein
MNQHGFLFQLQVCKVAKELQKFDKAQVTVPNIVDTIYESYSGQDRQKVSQRVRMFLRMLEDNKVCTRQEVKNSETIYSIDFEKVKI